jgi:hypothetical protein
VFVDVILLAIYLVIKFLVRNVLIHMPFVLVCDGHEKELMELFSAIEATRINRKGGSGNKRSDKVGNRGNRELKWLGCTVNYDAKGSGYSEL